MSGCTFSRALGQAISLASNILYFFARVGLGIFMALPVALCMSCMTAGVMAVGVFAPTRQIPLEGCKENHPHEFHLLDWMLVPAKFDDAD